MSDVRLGTAAPIDPWRATLAVWLANLAVAVAIASSVALLATIAGGGTAIGRVLARTATVAAAVGAVLAFVVLRLDLHPALRKLADARATGPDAPGPRSETAARKLLGYPDRYEKWMGGIVVLAVVGGLAISVLWIGGGLGRFVRLLPAGMVAVLLVVHASAIVTRRALRPALAMLPPPSGREAFAGRFHRRVEDLIVVPVTLALFFLLLGEDLRSERAGQGEWLERHRRVAQGIASSPAALEALGPSPDAAEPNGGSGLAHLASCDRPATGPIGRACRAVFEGRSSPGPAVWLDPDGGRGFAAAPTAARGVVLLAFAIPPPPDRAAWPLGVLAVALLGAHLFARSAGRRMGDALGLAAGAIERLREQAVAEDAPTPELEARPVVREIERITGMLPALASRVLEMRRTEEQAISSLAHAQRVKTQFLATMSHDLKGPLNSIIGFSELLLRGMEGPLLPAQRQDIELIYRAGEDLLGIINGILDSAKLEVGKLDLAREWVPSVELVSEAVRRARTLVGDKEITVESEIQAGLPPVRVDPHRIAQVIECLLSNAVKFMDRGVLRIRARVASGPSGPGDRHLRLDVADQGPGISPENRDRLFQAFHQIDGSASRRVGGTGLGLYIAKSLVELHGGRIWFESRVGAGSVFSVALPIEAPEDQNGDARRK